LEATTVLPPVKKPEVVPQLPKPRSSISPKLGRTKENSAILDLLGLGMFLICIRCSRIHMYRI